MYIVTGDNNEKANASNFDDWNFSEIQLRFIQSFFKRNVTKRLKEKNIEGISINKKSSAVK